MVKLVLIPLVLALALVTAFAGPTAHSGELITQVTAGLVAIGDPQIVQSDDVCPGGPTGLTFSIQLLGPVGATEDTATVKWFSVVGRTFPWAVALYPGQSADESPSALLVVNEKTGKIVSVFGPDAFPPLCSLVR